MIGLTLHTLCSVYLIHEYLLFIRMPDELDCKVNDAYLIPKDRSDKVCYLDLLMISRLPTEPRSISL